MNADQLIAKARKTNAQRDRSEARSGLVPLSKAPAEEIIRTAMEAIKAAIVTEDWETAAEAYAMLEGLVK